MLVGFSGGLDSSVLLHALAAQPALRARGLQALHVHHGLQPDADDWAAHCQRQALRLDVPLKGAFPAYEPELVTIKGANVSSPDFPSIVALERSARSGKASKTPATVTDANIRVERIAPSM